MARFVFSFVILRFLAVLVLLFLASGIARKAALWFPQSRLLYCDDFVVGAHQAKLFLCKIFFLKSVLQIDRFMGFLIFF